MTGLTTHVLDIARGLPAAGIRIELRRVDDDDAMPLAAAVTNDDGRTDSPLLETLVPGVYELRFFCGDYLASHHHAATRRPPFLDCIPVRFGINDVDRHHHVPLLLSPHGYSTYRGS